MRSNYSIYIVMLMLGIVTGCSDEEIEAPVAEVSQPVEEPVVQETTTDERPNILIIVTDDMALTDLGSFGGEIDTPNLEALARSGVRLANFHTGTQCAPTRAMLLSGLDHHKAGVGAMIVAVAPMLGPENTRAMQQNPGYEGHLNPDLTTLPEILQDAGYNTYMTGKWHLGAADHLTPQQHGFDRSFVLLEGGAAHMDSMPLWESNGTTYRSDGKIVDIPEDFYSTHYYTETLMDYIEEDKDNRKPFFAYLAYTAPHWPLQAPRESIARQEGKYDEGYDQLAVNRLNGLKKEGIFTGDFDIFPRHEGQAAWKDLSDEEKAISARTMEVYAAMVNDIDTYVGVLLGYLDQIGELDNTFIFFMSDNGPEGRDIGSLGNMKGFYQKCCDNSLENIGNAGSYVWIDQNWGRAHAVPHRMFKVYPSEGGLHTPAFATFPEAYRAGEIEHTFTSVRDVMPTLLELANVEYEQERSFLSLLKEGVDYVSPVDTGFGVETHGMMAYYKDNYKILKQKDFLSSGDWQLYNIDEDPAEMNDLSEQLPDMLAEMISEYQAFEAEVGVIDFESFKL